MKKTTSQNLSRRDDLDRRRYIRIKFPFTIHICTPEDCKISAYTENISPGGVMVTLMHELEPTTLTGLEIYTRQKAVSCQGKIAWVKKRESKYLVGRDFFDTGIEFKQINEKDCKLIQDQLASDKT